MAKLFSVILVIICVPLFGQFPPPAGETGTSAMYRDSSAFIDWAVSCTVSPGWQNIQDTTLGLADFGTATDACGKADNAVVSLGDGGLAVLSFTVPVVNGPGWDFAVFENSFSNDFLELAFVEVSSNGTDFFKFPSVSLTQTNTQVESFGTTDASQINNLAGKYRMMYGTPFDLDELKNIPGLDVNQITQIRITDVVGSIDSLYATYDSQGNKINDPWPTPFPTGGFDLDAVGVIHNTDFPGTVPVTSTGDNITLYPTVTSEKLYLSVPKNSGNYSGQILNPNGILMDSFKASNEIDVQNLKPGIYFLKVFSEQKTVVFKFIKV